MQAVKPLISGIGSRQICHATATVTTPANPVSVQARVNYVKRPPQGEELFTYVGDVPEHVAKQTNLQHEPVAVEVSNLRHVKQDFTLETNGFQLASFHVPAGINWTNSKQVEELYYPALEALLKKQTGASRVLVFDHTQRRGSVRDGAESAEENQKYDEQGNRPPVARVHVDYTTQSGIDRLKVLLPDEAERLLQTPFAVVQVWRPIIAPIDDSPLAMVDASTVAPEDLLDYAIHFPGRTGHNYGVKANPLHRWYYAKGMREDECYLFVCYDSRQGRARFTPHTGFKDPSTQEGADVRWSVEARAYCFWEHDPPAAPAQGL